MPTMPWNDVHVKACHYQIPNNCKIYIRPSRFKKTTKCSFWFIKLIANQLCWMLMIVWNHLRHPRGLQICLQSPVFWLYIMCGIIVFCSLYNPRTWQHGLIEVVTCITLVSRACVRACVVTTLKSMLHCSGVAPAGTVHFRWLTLSALLVQLTC
jgi:hypothetical protein